MVNKLPPTLLSFGQAIEVIKQNRKRMMFRKAWHGIELGKRMGISVETVVSTHQREDEHGLETVFNMNEDGSYNGGNIFKFTVDGQWYAWTPSQHDMLQDDWIIGYADDLILVPTVEDSDSEV